MRDKEVAEPGTPSEGEKEGRVLGGPEKKSLGRVRAGGEGIS